MPELPLTTEERLIALTLHIRQQENSIIELTASIVETATAVANIAACLRSTTDRQAVKEARIAVSKVLQRVKPMVEPESGCQCGGKCSAHGDD